MIYKCHSTGFFRDGFLGNRRFFTFREFSSESPPKEGTELTPWSEVSSPGESPNRTVESSLVVVGKHHII